METGANLSGANFNAANFLGANLSNAIIINPISWTIALRDASLYHIFALDIFSLWNQSSGCPKVVIEPWVCRLSSQNNEYVVGPGVNLSGLNLSGVRLSSLNLSGANLSYSIMWYPWLANIDFTGANLSNALWYSPYWRMTICPDGNSTGTSGNCNAWFYESAYEWFQYNSTN